MEKLPLKRKHSVKATLAEHHLAPSKRLGQNFLVQSSTAEAIVHAAQLNPDDTVIEIGVGLGALTEVLATSVSQVIGIEIDRGLIAYHEREKTLPANVSLRHGDILRVDLAELANSVGNRLKIIANLPYSISNPFIFHLIKYCDSIDQVTVMLQKEVADRLNAQPGTKAYGIPTILLGSCADIKTLMTIKPDQFHPKPKIDSQVIRITFHHRHGNHHAFLILQRVVRAAFASRRKTLLNNLMVSSLGYGFGHQAYTADAQQRKSYFIQAIESIGLPLNIRGEMLTLAHFTALAEILLHHEPNSELSTTD